ncbi:zinc finger BED domain-containing protein 4-like [Microplitis demolitor]|uniref:zinc finger BED domain-containing protein 4-like n=1 Tax=Microplitis demolitor TaxID=69319 RepID=UPI0004CCA34B|nr:zinc finger BED domain-containing protein 4-like [Microplitis demolitor]
MTVHAINELWNLRCLTLDTLEMTESHSAENIYNHLCNALSEWNIAEKTIAVVHDNAPNMVAAMRESSTADIKIGQSVYCFCHSLQIVVEKAFNEKNFKKHLQKVSAVVGHFKHSYKATNALKDAQKSYNLPKYCLISYCVTRWNSAYDMIEQLLIEQRQAVGSILLDPNFTNTAMSKKLLSSNLKWNYLKALVRILKPFEVATTVMSSQSESTIEMVRSAIHSMIDKFLKHDKNDSPKIRLFKEVFQEELEARFLNEDCDPVSALTCFLDPRYQDMSYETLEYRESVQKKNFKDYAQ